MGVRTEGTSDMARLAIGRRTFLAGGAGASAAALIGATAPGAAQPAANALRPLALPPPISGAERLERLSKARALMARHGIGAIIVEPGASLDYFTGV